MIKIILFLFHLLFLILPFVFTWVNEELFEFNKMLLIYASTLILGFFWILGILQKQIKLKATQLQPFLMFFLLSQILSSVFSIHTRTSIVGYYTRLHGGLLSTICYIFLSLIFSTTVQNFRQVVSGQEAKKRIHRRIMSFFHTLLFAGILVSLYAIPEHFGYSPSCLIITGKFNVDCWVQDVQNRVFASFGQPNWLAAYLVMLIPLAIHLFKEKITKTIDLKKSGANCSWKNYLQLIFYFISANLMWLALIFTKSRSGLAGLAVGLILYFSLSIIKSWQNKKNLVSQIALTKQKLINLFYKNFFIPCGFIILSLIFGTIYTPSLKDWLSKTKSWTSQTVATINIADAELIPTAGGTESGAIRKIVWQGAIKIWQRYPIFGSGVETFAYSYYQDRPMDHNLISEWDFLYNKAHNEFLNFLATSGIVGLLAYISLLCASFYFGFKKINSHPYIKALMAGLAGLAVSNFFGFSTVTISFLMFIFMIIISFPDNTLLKNTLKSGRNQSKKKPQGGNIKQFLKLINFLPFEIPVVICLIITLMGLNKISKIWQADLNYTQGKQLARASELVKANEKLQKAIELSPREALFYDELAYNYAQIAAELAKIDEASSSQEFEEATLQTTDITLTLNPRHLNFHKTKIRTLITLAQINPDYLNDAEVAAKTALSLAPTDAKLMYNLSLIQENLDKKKESLVSLLTAIKMKPNYHNAIYKLAEKYEAEKKYSLAIEAYQKLEKLLPEDKAVKQKIKELENLL